MSVPSLGQELYDKTQKQSFFQFCEICKNELFLNVWKLEGRVNLAHQNELQSHLKL